MDQHFATPPLSDGKYSVPTVMKMNLGEQPKLCGVVGQGYCELHPNWFLGEVWNHTNRPIAKDQVQELQSSGTQNVVPSSRTLSKCDHEMSNSRHLTPLKVRRQFLWKILII